MKYNEKADAFLTTLYSSVGAITPSHQFNLLHLELGDMTFSHNPSVEQKVALMEHELLEQHGLIEVETC